MQEKWVKPFKHFNHYQQVVEQNIVGKQYTRVYWLLISIFLAQTITITNIKLVCQTCVVFVNVSRAHLSARASCVAVLGAEIKSADHRTTVCVTHIHTHTPVTTTSNRTTKWQDRPPHKLAVFFYFCSVIFWCNEVSNKRIFVMSYLRW